jgi:chloramphenicol 3-O phosphotransferase
MNRLLMLLENFDVFFVGVHCPLQELERRERERGNRRIGEARADFEITHTFGSYDIELTSTDDAGQLASRLAEAWAKRSRPGVFGTMLQALRSRGA